MRCQYVYNSQKYSHIFFCKYQKIPDSALVVDIGDVKIITIETRGSESLCGVPHLDVEDSYELTGFLIQILPYLKKLNKIEIL